MTRKEAISLQYKVLSETQVIEKSKESRIDTAKYEARRLAWSNLMDLYNYSDSTYLSAEALFEEASVRHDSIGIVAAYKTLFNSPDTLVIKKYREKLNTVLSKSELRLGLNIFMSIKQGLLDFGFNNEKRDNLGLYEVVLRQQHSELQAEDMHTKKDMHWAELNEKYNKIYLYLTILIANRDKITPSSFYYEYVSKLDSITKTLPKENRYLRSLALNHINYVREGNQNFKSLKITLAELDTIIREMEKEYKNEGRIYKDYGVIYFQNTVNYINCFTELSVAEVDSCYNLIQKGLEKYVFLQKYYGTLKDFDYEKAYKHGEYDKCLVYAREILDTEKTKIWSINIDILIDQCISISKKNNNKNDLIFFMNKKLGRTAVIEKRFYNEQKAESNMVQRVFDTQQHNVQLLKEDFLSKKKMSSLIIAVVIGVGCLLIIIVLILLRNLNLERQKVEMMKRREEALQLAKDAAIKSAQLQLDFLHNISHEVRTPLNSIVGFSNLISEDPDLSREERDDFIQRISKSSEDLVKLIDDTLELSNLKNGSVPIVSKSCNINEVVRATYESFKKKTKGHVTLEFQSEVDDAFQIMINPERTQQVLSILIENAIKFTDEGTIRLYIESDQNMHARIIVEDTGCGIDPQLVPHLFNHLQKGNEFTSGIGIGLNIAYEICAIMGVELSYDTSFTSGSRFALTFICC
ncbi:MAG: HAMP domain-containing sensor histidine kinase [Bacteroidaceae bacterium]